MKALAKCDGFNYVLRDMKPEVANLMYLADFAQRTFREYWFELLPQREATELMLSCAEFFGKNEETERRELAGKLEGLETSAPEVFRGLAEWPERLNEEMYGDALTRNTTAAKIVLDEKMQRGMGGVYNYPDKVKSLARNMLNQGVEQSDVD